MKIVKKKINGYDVSIYKTKRYSTINMRFVFENDYNKTAVYRADLLASYISTTTKKYKTRKSLNDRFMELYSPGFMIENISEGKKMLTLVSLSFYDPELVKQDYLKEALTFTRDCLLEPNFEDGKLNHVELTRIKDNMISRVAEDLLNNQYNSYKDWCQMSFPNTYLSEDLFDSKEEIVDLLNGFSDEDLIKAHEDIFQKSCVGLIIMGNVKDEYLDYIEELFKFKKTKKLDTEYERYLNIDETTPFYTKKSDPNYSESILRYAYSCPSKSYKEELTYHVIREMLAGTGMLLHKVLRDEMKLVYRVGVGYNKYTKCLVMKAFLDKSNEQKAMEGFTRVLDMLKDGDLIKTELEKIKEKNALMLYTYGENKWEPFEDLYATTFDINVSKKERYKVIKTITEKDVAQCLAKLRQVKVHFYEGSKR